MTQSNDPHGRAGQHPPAQDIHEEQTVFVNAGQRPPAPGVAPADRQAALASALNAVHDAQAAPTTNEDAVGDAATELVGSQPHQTPTAAARGGAPVDPSDVATHLSNPSAGAPPASAPADLRGDESAMSVPKTQVVRGPRRPTRTDFHQEPVVAWLVVIGGPGLGAFRPLYTGNNTIGRGATNRVAIDFGDDAISSTDQAYIRYDSSDREFLFVPNLAKTNIVKVNEDKPTSAVRLMPMDVITMGQTQLVFVPFCGEDFDWSELADLEA